MTAKSSASRWLIRPRPVPEARLRLVCLPFAGGGASIYRLWPDRLLATVEVCAVQPPGRETRFRETPHHRMAPLIDELAEAIEPLLETPFAIFGHSLGSIVGFELARELRRRDLAAPKFLFASGRTAPQLPLRRRPIHALPEPEFRNELRKLNGTPRAVLDHDELMGLFSPIIRADLAVNESYAYRNEPPLDVPILALGGVDDPWANLAELEAWREQTARAFTCRQLPGEHFFIQTATDEVLSLVNEALAGYLEARP